MTAARILQAALADGVQISARDGRLSIIAPNGWGSPARRAELLAHKPAILRMLASPHPPSAKSDGSSPTTESPDRAPTPPQAVDEPGETPPPVAAIIPAPDHHDRLRAAFDAMATERPAWDIAAYTLSLRSGVPPLTCCDWLAINQPPRPAMIPVPPPQSTISRAELIQITATSIYTQRRLVLSEADAIAAATRLILAHSAPEQK